jgi:hypothetical protein
MPSRAARIGAVVDDAMLSLSASPFHPLRLKEGVHVSSELSVTNGLRTLGGES